MPKYHVTEYVVYAVVANTEDEAEQFIIDAEDRDKYVVAVTDRFTQPA